MKKLILLAILVVGGWYGYQWYTGQLSEASDHPWQDQPGDPNQPAPGLPDATSQAPQGEAVSTVNGLIADMAARLSDADALWQEEVNAGRNPAISEHALTLARLYSPIIAATYNKPELKDLQVSLVNERLTPLAETLFFTSRPVLEDPEGVFSRYTLKTGDFLDNIGRDYGMSSELINLMRGAKPESGQYRAGEVIKLVNVKDSGYRIHVDKSDFFMDVYIGEFFARRFRVGHGAPQTATPIGNTWIESREKYPQWTNPKTGKVYNFGEPGHILGAVWMRFNSAIGKTGLGIHGYTGTDGKASGTMESNGCIRMENEDALMLYNIMVKCQFGSDGSFITRAPMKVEVVE